MTNTLYFQGLRLWSNCGDPVQRRSIMWQVVPSLGEEDTGRIDYLDWTRNRPTASVSGVKKISGGSYDSGLRCLPNELPSVCWLHNSPAEFPIAPPVDRDNSRCSCDQLLMNVRTLTIIAFSGRVFKRGCCSRFPSVLLIHSRTIHSPQSPDLPQRLLCFNVEQTSTSLPSS